MPDFEINNKADLNKDYKPTDKEQDVRMHVYKRKYQMEESQERQRALRLWESGEKAWENIREEKNSWNSNYKVPLTQSVVESVVSEMIEQPSQPLILPRGDEDIPRAKVAQSTFEYTLDVADHDYHMEDVYRGGLVHGTTIGQEYFLKDKRTVQKVKDLKDVKTKNNKKRREYDSEPEEILEYDDVMMEWIHPEDVLVDEMATEFNRGSSKARDAIRRYNMHYHDAAQFFSGPIWNHLNNFRFVKAGKSADFYQFYKPDQERADESVEVLWYWARIPEDYLCVVINDVVVRMGPNPYKHKWLPFLKGTDIKRIGKFYGKGEPEVLESIQDEVQTLRRMMIDRHHLDIDKMFIGSPDLAIDEDEVAARPHGLISGSPDQIAPVEYNDIPLSVQATLRAINEDKVMSTGVDDRFQSVQKTPSTATEAAILKESTLKRIRMKLRSYERGFLVDMGRMRLSNIMQFYPQPKLEQIVGQSGTEAYKREMARLQAQGLLEIKDGQAMKRSYRTIRTEGKMLDFDERGQVQEKKEPGFHFFELKPEFFLPSHPLGFDIRFKAGPSLPVSKPLLRQQVLELFDRIMPVIVDGSTGYDPERLIDEVVEAYEIVPEDLKKQEVLQQQSVEANRIEMSIEMASTENQAVLEGKAIPPAGTPFAPPAHTEVHIGFIQSPVAQQLSEEQFQNLLTHTYGEVLAIQQRGANQGQTQQGPVQQNLSGQNQGNQATIPARIEGGNQVPTGRVLGNG